MKLTNQKTFEKWCEKNGFRAGALLDDAERWHSECDTNGGDEIVSERGKTRQRKGLTTCRIWRVIERQRLLLLEQKREQERPRNYLLRVQLDARRARNLGGRNNANRY